MNRPLSTLLTVYLSYILVKMDAAPAHHGDEICVGKFQISNTTDIRICRFLF